MKEEKKETTVVRYIEKITFVDFSVYKFLPVNIINEITDERVNKFKTNFQIYELNRLLDNLFSFFSISPLQTIGIATRRFKKD